MSILALDPAYGITKNASKSALVCYYPTEDGFEIAWDSYKPKKKELNERFAEILAWINHFALECDIEEIKTLAAYRTTAYGGGAVKLIELVGMFRGWGWMNGIINWETPTDNSIKSALAGHRSASKEAVALAVKAQWPNVPKNEPDVSDAAALALFVANRQRAKY